MDRDKITPEKRAEIRAAAKKATKGPWKQMTGKVVAAAYIVAECDFADARFIALTDPDTIIEMCDALDSAEKLKEFAQHVIKTECWAVDGADIQDKAKELGLIEPHIATKNDIDDERDYEVGDTIYRFSQALTQKGDKTEQPKNNT